MKLNEFLFPGRANILWPGLNSPIIKGREVLKRIQLPPDPKRNEEIIKLRDQMSRIRYTANPPLLRGWSGSRFPGQSVGPPDPVADCRFPTYGKLWNYHFRMYDFLHMCISLALLFLFSDFLFDF